MELNCKVLPFHTLFLLLALGYAKPKKGGARQVFLCMLITFPSKILGVVAGVRNLSHSRSC